MQPWQVEANHLPASLCASAGEAASAKRDRMGLPARPQIRPAPAMLRIKPRRLSPLDGFFEGSVVSLIAGMLESEIDGCGRLAAENQCEAEEEGPDHDEQAAQGDDADLRAAVGGLAAHDAEHAESDR